MSAPEQTFNLDEFRNEMLSEHNLKRATHHAPELAFDVTLNQGAQAWAEHLLSTEQFFHGNTDGIGQNLYWKMWDLSTMSQEKIDYIKKYYPSYPLPLDFTGKNLAVSAVSSWYNEVSNYSYDTTESINGNSIGHFTQLVWKDSSLLGCGAAWKLNNNAGETSVSVYVVCRYISKGNLISMQTGMSYEDSRKLCYGKNVIRP